MDTGEALFDEVHHVGACFEDSIDTSLDVCMCELCTRIGLLLFYGNTSLLYSRSLS